MMENHYKWMPINECKGYKCLGCLYGCLKDKEGLLRFIRTKEKEKIWLQPFPCWAILDEELLKYAVFLAVKDFKLGINKARKVNVEVLLRFAGTDQIRDAIGKFGVKEGEDIALLVINYEKNLKTIEKALEEKAILTNAGKTRKTKVDLERLQKKYDFSQKKLSSIQNARRISQKEAMKLAIIETMGLLPIR